MRICAKNGDGEARRQVSGLARDTVVKYVYAIEVLTVILGLKIHDKIKWSNKLSFYVNRNKCA